MLATDAENSEFLRLLCEIRKVNLNAMIEYDEINLETTRTQRDFKVRTCTGNPLGLAIDQLNNKRITRLINITPEIMYASVIGAENKDNWFFRFPLTYLVRKGPPCIYLFPLFIYLGIDVNHSPHSLARPINSSNYFSERILDKRSLDDTLTGLKILIQNGLMNFSIYPNVGYQTSIVMILILHYSSVTCKKKKTDLESVLKTLTSLGFGRGSAEWECDRHLHQEREYLNGSGYYFSGIRNPIRIQMVTDIINYFDTHSYSLKELCRNSLRLSIGGIKFKERVNQLTFPPILKNFVILQD